jgi:hypothetical protein
LRTLMLKAVSTMPAVHLLVERLHLAYDPIGLSHGGDGLTTSRAKTGGHSKNRGGFALVVVWQVAGAVNQLSRAANRAFPKDKPVLIDYSTGSLSIQAGFAMRVVGWDKLRMGLVFKARCLAGIQFLCA